jgi:hypothetical protein
MANSSQFVFPTMIAPAASSRCTTVASYGGRNVSRILDDAVVRMRRMHMLSLSATGTPASGPPLDAPPRSIASARASARSASTKLNALRMAFADWMRSSTARHTSVADTWRDAIDSRISAMPSDVTVTR